ncbi:T-cell surface glycoprotein CD3 gamma chain-like [Rhinophrynus dorsalis]
MAGLQNSVWVLILTLSLKCTTAEIVVSKGTSRIVLNCDLENVQWFREGEDLSHNDKTLDLGSMWDDPRGLYSCTGNKDSGKVKWSLEVYVRMCQNCIEFDIGTISGFVVADVIMIGFIALAVYYVSGSETRRPARASDKQNLIQNEATYSHLMAGQTDEYSHLTHSRK